MWNIAWTVKVSKLCNLRCRYCYEWDSLDNPARISIEQWRRILIAVRRNHDVQEAIYGGQYKSAIVWHGGEPLLLPLAYLERVICLQHEVLGTAALARGAFVNYLQTNLYSLDDAKLALLCREGFYFGVSFDVVRGVRVTQGGGEPEDGVLLNLERLRRQGTPMRGCVVLAQHTRTCLRSIYDFFEGLGLPFSVFPLSRAPLHALPNLALTEREMVEALADLFEYWMERGATLEVEPLRTCLQTVVMQIAGLARLPYDRTHWGDRAFVVDTTGSLYSAADCYVVGRSLGNVFEQSMDEILAAPAYAESVQREDQFRKERCCGCEFLSACDTYPAFATQETPEGPRCRITFGLLSFIHRYLHLQGIQPELESRAASLAHRWAGSEMAQSVR
jgi:uncharacterized protein